MFCDGLGAVEVSAGEYRSRCDDSLYTMFSILYLFARQRMLLLEATASLQSSELF